MTPRKRSPAQLAGQRQVQPSLMVAFAGGITAAGLADRPGNCDCEWAPGWRGDSVAGYEPDGWRLKFVSRFCQVSEHRAVLG